MMAAAVEHLPGRGFRIVYGNIQDDETSLPLQPEENTCGHKPRKYTSILAGAASAQFPVLLGAVGVFDCRILPLPRPQDVVEYFRRR